MAAFLDICRFLPTAGGTTDWTFAAVVQGYQSPAAAGASNGRLYKYRAESTDLTQWEMGEGAYNAAGGTLARTTVLFNSAGTTSKVNFSAVPQVAIVALKEDLISIEEANGFTATQQAQARLNIGAAALLRTRTVLTAGSGTYTTPAGCKAINVRMVGGGAGGGGGGASGGSTGGTGGTTQFGTMTANGGNPGNPAGSYTGGGAATGGDVNFVGGSGAFGWGAGFGAANNVPGGMGGASAFGGGGSGGFPAAAGQTAQSPGAGGGGGGGVVGSGFGGAGGSAGGYCEKLIVSPAASFSFAVGGAGGPGGAGSSGNNGGSGASGIIIIDEYY